MELHVQELTPDAFAPYGTYFDVYEGYSDDPVSFQADRMLYQVGIPIGSACSIRLKYRPLEITVTEYHDYCEEVFGGFNHDIVFHVGLLGKDGQPDLSTFAVFRLPAGSFARVKRNVLHHAGFVLNEQEQAAGVILLSPSAYTVDCKVIELEEAIKII